MLVEPLWNYLVSLWIQFTALNLYHVLGSDLWQWSRRRVFNNHRDHGATSRFRNRVVEPRSGRRYTSCSWIHSVILKPRRGCESTSCYWSYLMMVELRHGHPLWTWSWSHAVKLWPLRIIKSNFSYGLTSRFAVGQSFYCHEGKFSMLLPLSLSSS